MTTLISFLGKNRANTAGGYRPANYRFSANFIRTTPYFGLALLEYLKPDRLILVGTASSMWDVFFDQHDPDTEELLPLVDAVEKDAATPELLTTHERRIAKQIGIPIRCVLIPHGRNPSEQADILSRLAEALEPGETVVLDVTHSYRHLPMLALVAARYLSHVRQAHVENIYYGALEMTDPASQETPVLELAGLLRMLDWVEALAVYDKSGDYGVFSTLLEQDGMAPETAANLTRGAFFERSGNPVKAREALSTVLPSIKNHTGALGRLFRKSLARNIEWVNTPRRSENELALADRYLQRGDYLRAITYLHEGLVTQTAYKLKLDDIRPKTRQEAQKKAGQQHPEAGILRDLRNAMVHGVRADDDKNNRLLQDPKRLRQKLKELHRSLSK